jgi:hypothetical protein
MFILASTLTFAVSSVVLAEEPTAATSGAFTFGDDDGLYAFNGACEDGRFTGEGMGDIADAAMHHDAHDCMSLFASGKIDITEEERSLHPEGPLDVLDILSKIGKGGKAAETN